MSLSGFHLSVDSPPGPVRPPTPKRATAFDCSYPLEAVNMQPEYKAEYKPEFRPNKEVREYESVYYPAAASTNLQPWQYSPIFSTTNPPAYYSGDGYYPAVPPPPIDPWGGYHRQVQGPSTPLRSYSFERLNQPTGYGAASGGCPSSAYCVRSPNPSPVHTPSNSPVLNRSRFTPSPGSSPSLSRNPGTSRRINAVALPLPVKGGGAASKPPRPRPAAHRPPLHKSKTIDHSYLPPPLTLMHPPLDAGSKIPSLDSLYEQLKAFAASPEANAKGRAARVDAHLAADLAALVGDVTRARSASYSGASLSVRNQYHQPEVEQRLQRLEGDKDSLQMQISILMDQIEMQTEKIGDLEKHLMDKNAQLKRSEEIIQSEVLSRSSAETHQLELLSEMSSIKLRYAALEKENCELRTQLKRSEQDMVALVTQCYSVCGATLGPSMNRQDLVETLQLNLRNNSSVSPLRANPNATKALPPATSALSLQQHGSYTHKSKTPPANVFRKIEMEPFNSLPRHSGSSSSSSTMNPLLSAPPTGPSPKRAVVFAETEKAVAASAAVPEQDDVATDSMSPSSPHSPSLNSFSKQPRGLKKIFDKLKRNNSGALEGDPSSPSAGGDDFRRGGMRSTAGPRLGWNGSPSTIDRSSPKPTKESELPFTQWSVDEMAGWLHDMGLQLYINDIQRWMPSAKQLLSVSASELEKELVIKNALHKKKILLALEAKGRQQDPMSPIPILPELLTSAGKLDHQWTVRWLDDIGLPQYKDAFLESRVDGRMLHLLTVDDLCSHLKVTNLLHLICIRRGIQVLRLNEYNATCLQRRSVPDDPPNATSNQVAVWTNHRVMEWLRAVDLSEYAPNMRGSGVHGGLLVYEPRFTAELMATLLSIPQSKTLLRRHLATHFNQLLGRDVVQTKRDMETSPTHPALNPVSKVKILKKSQFTLKRKKGKPDEFDPEDWVCSDLETRDFNCDKNLYRKEQAAKSTDL